ncbi:hypothetical protein AAG906_000911 [Vitis piasezkii]
MDSQLVTVDQFSSAMVSIQEVIVSLKQRMDRHQLDPSPAPFILHSQTEVAPPPINMPTPTSDDTHARMDRLEQRLRQMRASDGGITWDDFDGSPMASLLAKFRMPNIERYMGVGSLPMSLSGITQRRELEALRQRLNESVTLFISRWREKIALIIDHSLERDHICMIMRSLQLRWPESCPTNLKRKKPSGGQCSNVCAISTFSLTMLLKLLIHLLHTPSLEHLRLRLLTLLDYRGFSELGMPSVTTNPLLTHSTHPIPPPIGGVHFIDLDQDDFIHMMS